MTRYMSLDSRLSNIPEECESTGPSRMKQYRAAKRALRKNSKLYILTKIGFVAVIVILYGLLVGASYMFKDGYSSDLRSRRATNESEHNPAPWETCDFETETTARRIGFIILWLCIIVWIFIGLALICDDFFVPSLEVISERLHLTEDVAGATFMAAGSSAPELFTSIAGVSFESDVGVGTIVGSAIFNLLIIIALSAALSLKTLNIDWRPLARDSIFYMVSIICFICFAWDGKLQVWDVGILFSFYCVYVAIMFVNQPLMRGLAAIGKCCPNPTVNPDDGDVEQKGFHHTNQLAVVTNSRRNSVASDTDRKADKGDSGEHESDDEGITLLPCMPAIPISIPKKEGDGPLAILKLIGGWLLFVLSFPWSLLFAYTVPNCGKDHLKKWFLVSFLMSVFWIAVCTFGMVFLVGRAGCSMEIQPFIMGLIIVAIGTSVPDALSSIIVARDGFGDMAVSNAIGSNVFDINLGIGLPSLIRIALDKGQSIELLDAEAKLLEIEYSDNPFIPHVKFGFILLFVLLVCLAIFILVKFRLNRVVGASFAGMYVIFIAYAIVQEFACDKGFGC